MVNLDTGLLTLYRISPVRRSVTDLAFLLHHEFACYIITMPENTRLMQWMDDRYAL